MVEQCLTIDDEEYILLAEDTDRLRWDCFLEGRIAAWWVNVVTLQLKIHCIFYSYKVGTTVH